jgi:hypothetical protein
LKSKKPSWQEKYKIIHGKSEFSLIQIGKKVTQDAGGFPGGTHSNKGLTVLEIRGLISLQGFEEKEADLRNFGKWCFDCLRFKKKRTCVNAAST